MYAWPWRICSPSFASPTTIGDNESILWAKEAVNASGTIDTSFEQGVTLVVGGSGTGGGLVTIINGVGTSTVSDNVAETIPLTVGNTTVNVHYIQVLTQPLGNAALDDVYGVLGVDVLDQLKAYTFDYRTMRFGVRPE